MSQHGSKYSLILKCDHLDSEFCGCRRGWAEFGAPSREEALKKAREYGWLAHQDGTGKDYCPEHRMAEHWAPRPDTGSSGLVSSTSAGTD